MILNGDCLEVMKGMADNSVDSIVTDPPYGLSFMGKKWDYDVPSVAIWREALRVLKPGGHLLAFAGSRTYHRLVINVEDAGFEIRDQIMWIYGSGFPKSQSVSRNIDKHLGTFVEGEETANSRSGRQGDDKHFNHSKKITADNPQSDAAKEWVGWGTALKPAHEPIVVARKPLIGTVVENVLEHGTGGLNIDACRVAFEENDDFNNWHNNRAITTFENTENVYDLGMKTISSSQNKHGRFPANVIHDGSEEVLEGFPQTASGDGKPHHIVRESHSNSMSGKSYANRPLNTYGDNGSAARFFYCAKPSQAEREAGCEDMDSTQMGRNQSSLEGGKMLTGSGNERSNSKKNFHPTVKPIALMEYLCKLVTPSGGVVLDPFTGSGTTGIAALRLGFGFIGIELDEDYVSIITNRIAHWVNMDIEFEGGDIVMHRKPQPEWL